jgi:hypothetical protein
LTVLKQVVDGRDKPGHDDCERSMKILEAFAPPGESR